MDNKVNKIMFLLIKTYLIGPYWTIRNNYMVASSATKIFLGFLLVDGQRKAVLQAEQNYWGDIALP